MMYRSNKPLRNMDKGTGVSGNNFSVHVAGETNDAHKEIVIKLIRAGLREVNSVEESDFILVFCPVVSRAGTDISEALESIPGNKPKILVVMHHTFSHDVVHDSSRLVDNRSVQLTVDCLFYQRKLLKCNRNDIEWFKVQKHLGITPPKGMSKWNMKCLVLLIGAVGLIGVVVIILTLVLGKFK